MAVICWGKKALAWNIMVWAVTMAYLGYLIGVVLMHGKMSVCFAIVTAFYAVVISNGSYRKYAGASITRDAIGGLWIEYRGFDGIVKERHFISSNGLVTRGKNKIEVKDGEVYTLYGYTDEAYGLLKGVLKNGLKTD